MTRKDFVLIAEALATVRRSYAPHGDPNLARACDDHAKRFAEALRSTNPNFKPQQFLDAAGYKVLP